MIRNLKVLMLASVAALALNAVAASAAQAEAEFHSGLTLVNISSTPDGTGKASHVVSDVAGGSVTCSTASFTGKAGIGVSTTTKDITVTAAYGGCTFAGQTATVNMHSCDYTFMSNSSAYLNTDTGAGTGKTCAEDPITVSVPSPACEIAVYPQFTENAVTYKNITTSGVQEVTLETHATGINYIAVGAGCPTAGEASNGSFTTGNTILTATNPVGGAMVNIKWE